MENIIDIKNVTKKYGKNIGVSDISIEVKKGEVLGFIGPNGAGKSTTIKCIMDLININTGTILIENIKVNRNNTKLKEKIGYLPSEVNLYEDLTVQKMIEYSNSFYSKDCMKKASELVKRLEIDTSKKINELSLGNLKKLGIILALMHEPIIIIMDEPTSGLDPLMQEEFYKIIKEEKEKGHTIFYSSHNLNEVKKICDRVAIIKQGKIIKISTIENLNDSNLFSVEIASESIEKIKKELDLQNFKENKNEITFVFSDVNLLINKLSKFKLDKLLINELDIEEIFMHYYKD